MTTIERTMSTTSTKLTARSSSCTSVSSTRKQNRSHFAKYYSDLCHIQHSHPLSVIKQNLDKGILDFYCDRIKFDEWWSIINALSCDKTLHLVAIRCRHPQKQALETADTELKARAVTKQPVVTTRFVLLWLTEAIKMCLNQSSTLSVLELEGLPLSYDYLTSVTCGLAGTTTLQHLSLSKCPIGDEGAEKVCQAVRNLPSVASLDLSQCNLTERGADAIAGLIKYQKLNRYSEAWKQTLRYRDPDVEAMPGLRRITLNGNSALGDEGIHALTEEIKDDLWLRALDVQDCGLTDVGGRLLVDLVESNGNLVIIDARLNPFMEESILLTIMNQLALNNQNKNDTEYKWINKNPELNKKKFQVSRGKPRPWTSHSSTRLTGKAPPPSEYSSGGATGRPLLKRSNTTLNDEAMRRKAQIWAKEESKIAENERLRLQLRDLTLILSQEIRHKLSLMEENKALKELLQREESEKKKIQSDDTKIQNDTFKVIEETINTFGKYMEQKQRKKEDEEEYEKALEENDENPNDELPELVSNLQLILKKAASETDKNIHKLKKSHKNQARRAKQTKTDLRPSVKNQEQVFIDSNIGCRINEDKLLEENQFSLEKNRKPQIIWEEEETSSNFGKFAEENLRDSGKSKAQAMFLNILKEKHDNRVRVGKEKHRCCETSNEMNYREDNSSDESDTNTQSTENLNNHFSSSNEYTSS